MFGRNPFKVGSARDSCRNMQTNDKGGRFANNVAGQSDSTSWSRFQPTGAQTGPGLHFVGRQQGLAMTLGA